MVRAIALKNTFTALSLTIAAVLMLLAVSPALVNARPGPAAAAAKPGDQTIVQIAQGNNSFDVLVAAVVHAGLADALSGSKQYTVFAPTDKAFVSLLGASSEAEAIETIQSLEPEAVGDILAYHVINGRRISTSVLAAPQYRTIGGATLTRAELVEANVGANGLNISASNGVIHVLDKVLIP
jgi:uncharacterized surface protein with fasciclin (FAS1) repeats